MSSDENMNLKIIVTAGTGSNLQELEDFSIAQFSLILLIIHIFSDSARGSQTFACRCMYIYLRVLLFL